MSTHHHTKKELSSPSVHQLTDQVAPPNLGKRWFNLNDATPILLLTAVARTHKRRDEIISASLYGIKPYDRFDERLARFFNGLDR